MLRTPIYPAYAACNARLIAFGAWELPVSFHSIVQEHEAVRTRAGLFDVSHMGQFLLAGDRAWDTLQRVMTNDFSSLSPGKARYTLLCTPSGGVIDDVIVYCLTRTQYLIVVNAANIAHDYAWISSHLLAGTTLTDVSSSYAMIALQGPLAQKVLLRACEAPENPPVENFLGNPYGAMTDTAMPAVSLMQNIAALRPFQFHDGVRIKGVTRPVMVARTGYTGEDGFELLVHEEEAVALWHRLCEEGRPEGMLPVGLGARDTLRLEAAYPLYGHEFTEALSPCHTPAQRFISWTKGDFIGRDALKTVRDHPENALHLVGLHMPQRTAVPRAGYAVHPAAVPDAPAIGHISSGGYSPTLGHNIAMAFVPYAYTPTGTALFVSIRGQNHPCTVVPLPFYVRTRHAPLP